MIILPGVYIYGGIGVHVNLIDISTLLGSVIETDAAGIVIPVRLIPVTDSPSIGTIKKRIFSP
jgi:hypothetical protein